MIPTPKRAYFSQALFCGGLAAATAVVSLVGPGLTRSVRAALQDSPKTVLDEAWQIVNREYVDGTFNQVDWQATRQTLLNKNYNSREQAYTALRSALEQLQDPYTRFMDPKQYEALSNQTSGELSGVGMRLELNEKTKVLTVVEPIENSPALKAGIQSGDQILAVDDKPTQGLNVEKASELIRGDVGSKVKLRVRRQGRADFDVAITRARIELPTVRYSLQQEGKNRIGYIRLNEFSAHAADQMRRAIKDLSNQKVDAFVLDLRGNPGGLLQASIDISRMWMNAGSIVRTVDRQGNSEEIAANRTALTNLPLAILVDGNSASSSEILTGALKDNKRAVIVGSQTFGKALVQSVHTLSDGSGLAVTIAHYYTPNGTDISHKGITPDILSDLNDSQRQTLSSNPKLIGTKEDPQYAKAVTVLQTAALNVRNGVQATR
ncbi:MAG: S41 family peptidase [Scytolyngbya sp. HA4215-MV1]|jgi:carboxyl-terminal processing protease|nr:S41 family peptidase [Scytolyngbya sp. HA4215-MV1]